MTERPCPWNTEDVVKLCLFYFMMIGMGCPLLLSLLEKIWSEETIAFSEDNILLLLTLLINTAVCLYILRLVSRRCPHPLSALGLSLEDWRRHLPRGLLLYLLSFPIILSAGQLVEYAIRVLGGTPQHQEVVTHFMEEQSPGVMVYMLFFATLFGPFTEELLFRGFLQPALRATLGVWKAILLSAFLFALVHLDPYVFLQIFLLGLVLAYLFEKTGTLLASISVHMLHNTATLTYILWNREQGNLLG
jgi:membrane protease YdiL (CAAX protease family)